MTSSPEERPTPAHELRCLDRGKLRRILQTALIHDLKAPLNTATLVLDLLGRSLAHDEPIDADGRARLLENVEEVRRELRRLSEGLPGLLSLADPGAEEPRPFDLAGSLGCGLDLLRQQVLLRGIRLHRRMPSGPVVVTGRASDLRHALLNVVLNALEATPRGQEVHVTVEAPDGAAVRVRVEDSGEGIAEDALESVFAPRMTTRPGHPGLGLTVARDILREHGGTIRLNRRPGGGTVATIELPAVTPDAVRGDAAQGASPAGTPLPEVGA